MTKEIVLPTGETLTILDEAVVLNEGGTALFKKKDRVNLSDDKRNDLFHKATNQVQKRYDVLNITIEDPMKLSETYDLGMSIATTKENFIKYDMHDVFTVVETPKEEPVFHELFENYSSITVDTVADSNNFYSTLTDDSVREVYRQNLRLTAEYLQNNSEERLRKKVEETYNKYLPSEKGGPLYFKLMMDILQSSSEEAAKYLIKVVRNIKVTDYDGENIETVVSLIRGAVNRLDNLRDQHNNSSIPKDFIEDIVAIFQTTSIPKFNSTFELLDTSKRLNKLGGAIWKPTIDNVLTLATDEYRRLLSVGEWTGVKNKSTQSIFYSDTSNTTKCFNCGEKHRLQDCKKPLNQDTIKANKKAFYNSKRKNRGNNKNKSKNSTPAKWLPPTDDEKKKGGTRTIDGHEMYYNYKRRLGSSRKMRKMHPRKSLKPI